MKASMSFWLYFMWPYIQFWFLSSFFLLHNLAYPWWIIFFVPRRALKRGDFLLFASSLFVIGLYANVFRFPDVAYLAIKRLTELPAWSEYPRPLIREWLGTLTLIAGNIIFILFFCWYDIPRCIGWGEGWYRARKSAAGKLELFLRWVVAMPLLLISLYLLWPRFLQEWSQVVAHFPYLLDELLQPMHPGCPVSYLGFIGDTWGTWLGFTLSMLLGLYVFPWMWLRHLRRRAWSVGRRGFPLALLQLLLALYFLVVWPVRMSYAYVARVTCDARYLVPPPPLDTVFYVLNGALFWAGLGVLGVLVWRCRRGGRCAAGVREAFPWLVGEGLPPWKRLWRWWSGRRRGNQTQGEASNER